MKNLLQNINLGFKDIMINLIVIEMHLFIKILKKLFMKGYFQGKEYLNFHQNLIKLMLNFLQIYSNLLIHPLKNNIESIKICKINSCLIIHYRKYLYIKPSNIYQLNNYKQEDLIYFHYKYSNYFEESIKNKLCIFNIILILEEVYYIILIHLLIRSNRDQQANGFFLYKLKF